MQVSPIIQVNLVNVPLTAVALPAGLSAACKADIIIKLHPEFLFEKGRIRDGNHYSFKIDAILIVEAVVCHTPVRPDMPPLVGNNVNVRISVCNTVVLGLQQKLKNQ